MVHCWLEVVAWILLAGAAAAAPSPPMWQMCSYCRPQPQPTPRNPLPAPPTEACHCDFENGTAYANGSVASYEEVCRSCGKVWLGAGRMVPTRTMQNGADYNDFPVDALLYNLTGDTEYLDRAVTSLRWYAQAELNGTLADCSNHCFEPLNSYQVNFFSWSTIVRLLRSLVA